MRTPDAPSIVARAGMQRRKRLLSGTLLSFTSIAHPPKGFPERPRIIGLVELTSGQRVLAPLLLREGLSPTIGQTVEPRMVLSRINEEGLRLYEVAYELTTRVTAPLDQEKIFPEYILALTGPSGVGKSTVRRLLTRMLSDFTAEVPLLTTRAPRGNDDQGEKHLSVLEFERLKHAGEIVSWIRLSAGTEEYFEGYRAADITTIWQGGRIPVVVTETHLLKGLANHFGRRAILSFGLLPPGHSRRAMLSQLLHRLRNRGHDSEEQIRAQLTHAKEDLQTITATPGLFDHVLVNEDLDTVIETLKGHVLALAEA
ncbi:MAG: OB-fold domain-containing protein [Candidatus Peribacteraceae bacterium]|nr:OB-fold domain-containing protein [Candidatus Peribacteraceae bacterium]